ncbi:winged helix-turn-helix domain-containing protein [Streptomyces antimicrobicus]|uniref:Winged helix-turn-helix domain-containing protein n=1 Tax=Streptomyces antimicrobicus TaxID=2883108 RepID=A0ABS8B8F3_9ACTN|nr:winged helix-turn-helix domain-containing protein [Streptomyces antimicrobicus]MCB5180887.1 winged helix-turn-helix domain-containing protein [Streptomyces antimicrobicus]
MANTRSLASAATAATAATANAPRSFPSAGPRHRLRAVDRDEVARVVDLLPPGATLLPAPQHTVPALPGRPPMIGYLVLVPADQQPALALAPALTAAGAPADAPVGAPADGPGAAPARGHGDAGAVGDALVRIDTAQRTAEVDGQVLDLTYLEFELLAHLVANPHRVHSRDQLVTTVWGYGHVGDGRTVDVHIARLRRKLGPRHRGAIQTVRRVGYKYAP